MQKVVGISGVEKYLKGKRAIFDVGTGPHGSPWWDQVDKGTTITGIDLYFYPQTVPKHVSIYKLDASDLGGVQNIRTAELVRPKRYIFKNRGVNWLNRFDLIVANHILEHVSDPGAVISGMSQMIRRGGLVYAGFPDSNNFTDIFYHLVHPNGGGHIQLLTKEMVVGLFKQNGFKLKSCRDWPDSWDWLRHQYNWKSYMWPENPYLDQKKIDYLCDTFLKELTPKKGYFYGWEMVFEKH